MSGFNGTFDATQFDPTQGTPTHPAGKFPAYISKTEIKANKDNTGGYLAVELTTQAGVITSRYNLFSTSAQAVEIAQRELSSICHAVGVLKPKDSQELHNKPLIVTVDVEKNEQNGNLNNRVKKYAAIGAATEAPKLSPHEGLKQLLRQRIAELGQQYEVLQKMQRELMGYLHWLETGESELWPKK